MTDDDDDEYRVYDDDDNEYMILMLNQSSHPSLPSFLSTQPLIQAVYVPADDLTDPAPATTFAHLDATTVLSRQIAELGELYNRGIE